MNKIFKAVLAALCGAALILPFAACGENDAANNDKEQEIVTPKPPAPVKKKYNIITDGYDVLTGNVTDGNALNLENAVAELNKPVILPLGKKAEWEMEFKATLMPDGAGGGQFFNSNADLPDGRVYFGVNGQNSVLFMGVCIGDTYANYCWDVPSATLSTEHEYEIEFDGGQFTLSIDDGEEMPFTSVNVNQSGRTDADGRKASKELLEKICAVTGQKYVEMRFMGSASHPCTNVFTQFTVETTTVKGYENMLAHPLFGSTVYFLGSSVTRGHGGNTDGISFADLVKTLTGAEIKKESVSGTNLAIKDDRNDSYSERLSLLNLQNAPDALIIQLSTNDFVNDVPMGALSQNGEYDKKTLTGALEYIISTVNKASPETKIIIYTCPLGTGWSKYKEYGNYVNGTLKQLAEKWKESLHILDLYNADFIKVPSYMQDDELHPQKEGYAQVFTPKLLNLLMQILF